jgi:TolB-like protein
MVSEKGVRVLKIRLHPTIGLGTWVLACLLALSAIYPAYGQNPGAAKTILVLPPTLHAGQPMDFLRKGIVDMLTGRLAVPGKLTVRTLEDQGETAPSDDAAAVALGKRVAADYVVLESVVILGSSVSIDAHLLETATSKKILAFSRTGSSQADIIAHVDELAARITTQVLGKSPAVAAAPPVTPGPAAASPAQPADIHQHPEKLLARIGGDRGDAAGGLDGGQSAMMRLLLRGRRMDRQIRGVTSGDVDGDGRAEIVCIDSRSVLAFRIEQDRLVKIAQTGFGTANIGVDTADLNGNGVDEIFVTHFDNDRGKVLSYVLEWDGQNFKRIAANLRWYFRSVNLAGRGRILVGQRQGIEDRFLPGIFEIDYQGGAYDGAQKLTLPPNRTVFGFAQGAVRDAGGTSLVDYSRSGYLRVQDHKGREEWTSVESYGSSANALLTQSKDDPNEQDIFWLPSRIHLQDLDGDGLQEIVAVRNDDSAGVLSRTRLFKQGRLEILKWDQLGLMPVQRTRGVAKLIGDFTLADVNGDGAPEIVAAIVQKTRSIVGAGSSYLAVFSLAK